MPAYGIGLTDLAPGITQSHDRDLRYNTAALLEAMNHPRPKVLAFPSRTGGRAAARAFGAARPDLGPQTWTVGPAAVWVLPSSSCANNAVPYSEKLAIWQQRANYLGG